MQCSRNYQPVNESHRAQEITVFMH